MFCGIIDSTQWQLDVGVSDFYQLQNYISIWNNNHGCFFALLSLCADKKHNSNGVSRKQKSMVANSGTSLDMLHHSLVSKRQCIEDWLTRVLRPSNSFGMGYWIARSNYAEQLVFKVFSFTRNFPNRTMLRLQYSVHQLMGWAFFPGSIS